MIISCYLRQIKNNKDKLLSLAKKNNIKLSNIGSIIKCKKEYLMILLF